MNEIEAIIRTFAGLAPGAGAALATVVKVEGSAYRRPGARMLLTGDGVTTGTISGGCLESDVRERAQRVMQGGNAAVVCYDSTRDDDAVFGLGLGCNGIVHVLIEPVIAGAPRGLIPFLADARRRGQEAVMATVIESEGIAGIRSGFHLMLGPERDIVGDLENPDATRLLVAEMRAALDTGSSVVRSLALADGRFEALIEVIAPPTPLVIFGAGHDAQPLAQFARQLGWQVTVVDHRAAFATTERFPTATRVVCGFPDELLPTLGLNERTVAMVMTHHLEQDRLLLKTLLSLPLRYLGILGPRSRTERLLKEIEAEGTPLNRRWLECLHGPAGLDIGAETPEEIALSVLAEMQAALVGRSGGRLRDYTGPIHT